MHSQHCLWNTRARMLFPAYVLPPVIYIYIYIRSGSQRECNINNNKRESNINEKRGTTFDRSSGSLSKSPPNQRRTKKRSSSAKREKGNLGHEGSEGSFRGGNGNLGGKLGEEKCLEELINAMKEQIKLETELESMRQDMSLLVDFDIHNAFHYFDKEGKGYLNTNDINVVLEDLSITPLQDDVFLFISRYDPNLDCRMTYNIYIYIYIVDMKTFGKLLCHEQRNMRNY